MSDERVAEVMVLVQDYRNAKSWPEIQYAHTTLLAAVTALATPAQEPVALVLLAALKRDSEHYLPSHGYRKLRDVIADFESSVAPVAREEVEALCRSMETNDHDWEPLEVAALLRKLETRCDELWHERNVLQKICAKRSDQLDRIAAVSEPLLNIGAERARQIEGEGWSTERDDEIHWDGGLARAAACYALYASRQAMGGTDGVMPREWPWDYEWWKPQDQRRNLVKAGALIVAEIERLDRSKL